jgi:MFS family permease
MNMSSPVLMAYAMSLVPARHRPLAASLMTLSWNGGWAVASWISGRLQVTAGFAPLFAITCTLYITVIVSFYVLFRGKSALEEPQIAEGFPLAEDERV